MSLVDLLLNASCLVLWLTWRSGKIFTSSPPAFRSLVSTLETERSDYSPWVPLVLLFAILLLRPLFYWQIGPSASWTPRIDVGPLDLMFRSDLPARIFAYSFLAFFYWGILSYIVLLFFLILHRDLPQTHPEQAWIRLQFGILSRWPRWVQLLVAAGTLVLLWIPTSLLLVRLGLFPKPILADSLKQGAIIAVGGVIFWQYAIGLVLLLYLVNSYVYLGRQSIWTYIDLTGKKLLRPLSWAPLAIMRVDLRPVIAIIIVFCVGQLAERALDSFFRQLI